jgi:hypothetical protein
MQMDIVGYSNIFLSRLKGQRRFIMGFVHTGFAFLISAGGVLSLAADARAQSCNNYSPQLEGNYQYQLGNSSCIPLTGVSVTVAVTQDIIVASSTLGYNGFSMQLNANGPSSGLTSSQLYWQQFVMMVGSGQVLAHSQQFSSGAHADIYVCNAGVCSPGNDVSMGSPSTINNTFLTIRAGTTFTWTLATDAQSNVVSATYSAHDNQNTTYTPVTEYIPAADRAPIDSITMDIVGYNDYSYTTFQSGAGTITYAATSLSSSYSYPSCASNTGTGENSDSVYGPLVAGSGGTFTQTFFTSTKGVFRNGDCGYPGTGYPSGDWAPGGYKGVCPLDAPMYGISRVPGQTWSESVECGMPGQAAYSNPGTGCHARTVTQVDNRGDTDSNWDWDPGSYKTECAANEFVAGVSQASGNGVLTNILCCPASVTHKSCDAQVFYNGDSPAFVQPDWDGGYYKGQCPAGQYVAGISTPAYSSIGINGAAHALLCCSQ